jgi:hypothetical protein
MLLISQNGWIFSELKQINVKQWKKNRHLGLSYERIIQSSRLFLKKELKYYEFLYYQNLQSNHHY